MFIKSFKNSNLTASFPPFKLRAFTRLFFSAGFHDLTFCSENTTIYNMKHIKFYELENGKEPVKEWLLKLDSSTRAKVVKRLERIYDDSFGDYKQIAPNLYELRFFFGKGYRIYYTVQNNIVIILLHAGDKSDQQKDIAIAKKYLNNIKEQNND